MNKKHIQFVDQLFICRMNASKAYTKAYDCNPKNANRLASRLLLNDDIQNLIQERFDVIQKENNITINDIITKLWNLVDVCKENEDRTTELNTLCLLAKILGAYKKKERKSEIVPLQINIIVPSSNPDRVNS